MNNIITLSKKLIRVNSTKENLKGLKEVLQVAKNELFGFETIKYQNNSTPSLLFSNKKNVTNFKILLNAHLDVVPAKEYQFKPFERKGKLFGRGAQDMKAAAAVEILVFKEVAPFVDYPLGLQLVTDEEIGGFDGTKYQVDKGVRADFVIAGEPTEFGINNKAKGVVWVKVITTGKTAHGAYPWDGENAITKMQKILTRINDNYPVPKKETWKTTVNIASIETANKTFNKIPDICELFLDIRYIPEESSNVIKSIKNLIGYMGELEVIMKEPSQFTDQNNHYVNLLKNVTEDVNKVKAKVIVKHGGSDVRHFNTVGCDGVTFGPIGGGLHTDNEWVDIISLENYYMILKNFLLKHQL